MWLIDRERYNGLFSLISHRFACWVLFSSLWSFGDWPAEQLWCCCCCCCCCCIVSVVSDSVRPHRRQPTRLPVPGILEARTLEWVSISFSSAWKWKVKGKSVSRVRLLATPWTAAYQAPPSVGFSRQEYWSGVPFPSPFDRLGNLLQQRRLRPYSDRTGIWIYTRIASSTLSPSTVSIKLIEAMTSLLIPFDIKLNSYFGIEAYATTTSTGTDTCSILEKGKFCPAETRAFFFRFANQNPNEHIYSLN